MGEELGNYVHQNSNITVHTDPPGSSFGTQTERETVYMGEELGNYVHQNRQTE